MRILITGGNGSLANCLKEYIDGDYYGKDMLDVTSRNCIRNLPAYDILIHTATGNKKINDKPIEPHWFWGVSTAQTNVFGLLWEPGGLDLQSEQK